MLNLQKCRNCHPESQCHQCFLQRALPTPSHSSPSSTDWAAGLEAYGNEGLSVILSLGFKARKKPLNYSAQLQNPVKIHCVTILNQTIGTLKPQTQGDGEIPVITPVSHHCGMWKLGAELQLYIHGECNPAATVGFHVQRKADQWDLRLRKAAVS